jgi:hypothetical protein
MLLRRSLVSLVFTTLGALATLPACGGGGGAGDDDDDGAGPADAATLPGDPDAQTPKPDAATATPDAATATPDAATSSPDAMTSSGDAGVPPGDVVGCTATSKFLAVPQDPAAAGPWPVGARQVKIGRLTVEVWYPATPGSETGKQKVRYDIRKALPMSEQAKIPDNDNPWQDGNAYKDLPIDPNHGPYPVVMFIHGTAAFRTQSLSQMTHWASRGFVVLAADHPGLWLADSLALACFQPQSGPRTIAADVDAMFAAVTSPTGDMAFLAGRLDLGRAAVVGHSAGANEANNLSDRPGVQVVMPLAGSAATKASPTLKRVLHMAAQDDAVVNYSSSKSGYNSTAGPKRFVGIDNSGHLLFSQLCDLKNGANKNILQVAQQFNVCGAALAGGLFDCKPNYLPASVGTPIVNYATTATLEGVLKCTTGDDAFATIKTKYPDVVESLSSP